jgi:two-component sensor histidine kinase
MMNRVKLTVVFISIFISVKAQDVNKHVADSLSQSLSKPTTDTDRINTLLKLAEFNIHQRHVSGAQINIAESYINSARQLDQKLKTQLFTNNILISQSCLYKARGNTAAGKALLNKTIVSIKTSDNKALLGRAYYEMSEYYNGDFMHNTMLDRIKYLQLAIAAYQGTSHVVEMARCYRFLADLHQLMNDPAQAFAEAEKALKYYKSVNYKEVQGTYNLLGKLYYAQGDYNQALSYELMALKTATNSPDDNIRLICEINNNLGNTFFKLNDNQQALTYFTKSIEIAEREEDNGTIYLLAASVVDAHLKLNEPVKAQQFLQGIIKKYPKPTGHKYEAGDYGISKTYLKIYMALKQYDRTHYYYDQLVRETKNPNINLYVLSSYYELIAKYNIENGRYKDALTYLKRNKELLDSMKDFTGMARNYNLWFSLDTLQRSYKSAIVNVVKANRLNDSIFNSTKSRQIEQLQVEFETREKENQIYVLNQNSKLERANLKRATLVRNFTTGGVILFLIIAVLLYRQNRQKQKNNEVAVHKNELLQRLLTEKEWLLKEVHHRVKNNLHTVICLLESQAAYLEKDALKAVQNSQNRIYAMSLIHQKLYQSENIKTIDVHIYVEEFMQYLIDSFGNPSNIHMVTNIAPIKLGVAQAIPLGLIINEAVTNAFKYAFPGGEYGEITIELEQIADQIKLVIADNGIGMFFKPGDVISNSLGIELMKGLITEIDGNILFENDNGTKIIAFFNIEDLHPSSLFQSPQQPNPLEI